MIDFRFSEGCEPRYMTRHSAAADLLAREGTTVAPGARAKIPTGVWIAKVDWDLVPEGFIPELQIRARSGLAFKKGLSLSNGVGTVDADYRDEICVLLTNHSKKTVELDAGDRVAQMTLNLVHRLDSLKVVEQERSGGFGSTGKSV